MFIQTEETPNPTTIKFIPGVPVLERETAEFRSPAEAARSPLAERLFRVAGVTGIFLGRDFVSVSKDAETPWTMLKAQIIAALADHFSSGTPVMLEGAAAPKKHSNPIVSEIEQVLDLYVRPAVAADGGDVAFDRFEDGIVYLSMQGACSGCPSASATLKMGIERMLKHYIPEVMEVRQAEDY